MHAEIKIVQFICSYITLHAISPVDIGLLGSFIITMSPLAGINIIHVQKKL